MRRAVGGAWAAARPPGGRGRDVWAGPGRSGRRGRAGPEADGGGAGMGWAGPGWEEKRGRGGRGGAGDLPCGPPLPSGGGGCAAAPEAFSLLSSLRPPRPSPGPVPRKPPAPRPPPEQGLGPAGSHAPSGQAARSAEPRGRRKHVLPLKTETRGGQPPSRSWAPSSANPMG